MAIVVAIDAMGGDHGIAVTVAAALDFLARHPLANAILVGQPEPVASALQRLGKGADQHAARLRVHGASEVVSMDDPPAQASADPVLCPLL